MKRRDFLFTAGLAASRPGMSAETAQAAETRCRAGFSERDISPSVGMERPGGYYKSYHKSFHDPCKVRAAVLDDGRKRVALVGVDALMIPAKVVTAARVRLSRGCGLPPEAVMVGASHSHSSGPVGMVQPGEYDHADPFVRALAYKRSSAADPAYLKHVEDGIVAAVEEACQRLQAARCGFGLGSEDKVAFNRRFRMRNGLTWTHPGKGNPDIVEAAGPIDPAVGVAGAFDRNAGLMGCIVHYACHATTNPGGISANWIYYMEKVLRGYYGSELVVVFLPGFSGDVTQVDNLSPYENPDGETWAKLVGGRVGAEALKVLLGLTPGEFAVDFRSRMLRIPRRRPSPERVARCRRIAEAAAPDSTETEYLFAKEIVLLDALLEKEPVAAVEVQAIQAGPVAFLSTPGEMFCQLGLDLKKQSPFPITCPVELANGSVGYVPTEEAFGPHGGGYETRLTAYSNLEPAAGRRMIEALAAMAREMTPGKIPAPRRVPAFMTDPRGIGPHPWSYGSVPPELS